MVKPMSDKPQLMRGRHRQAISSDLAALATYQPSTAGALPLVCQAQAPGVSLDVWGAHCKADIQRKLCAHGAILFRGFDVADVTAFSRCVQALSGEAIEYKFRASPRTQIEPGLRVYTSTDYPADEVIFPHNEHAYSQIFPLELYFFCAEPAAQGGETPLGATRSIARQIAPDVREEFARRGVMYVRNYGDGMGLPWQTVFQTTDQAEVERYCAQVGMRCEWKSQDRLRTRQSSPAIVRHPITGEQVWFNHATFFHALSLPESARATLLSEYADQDLPQNTFYGDGGPIAPETIQHLQSVYLSALREFTWRRADVLLIDNLLTVHGRNAYRGPRLIMTAMAKPQRSAALAV